VSICGRRAVERVYQSVHGFVRGLACLETVVELLSPRTHLYSADKLGLDHCLLVQARQDGAQVLADEVRLGASSRVECRERKSTDSLE
jgi:uncharacterized protein (DUF2126 family)